MVVVEGKEGLALRSLRAPAMPSDRDYYIIESFLTLHLR